MGQPVRWRKKTGEGREEEGERADGRVPIGRERKREKGGRGSGWEVGPARPTRGKERKTGLGVSLGQAKEREEREPAREGDGFGPGWATFLSSFLFFFSYT
jgi:hypothetical protein